MGREANASITIRPAEPRDRDGLERLYREVQAMHHEARPEVYAEPRGALVDEAWFDQQAERPAGALLVALKDGEVAGLSQIMLIDVSHTPILRQRRIARIDAFAVRSADRRQGIGTGLMQATGAWARRHGAVEIQLGVDASNQAAVRFYEKLGLSITLHRMAAPLSTGDTG